MMVQVENRRGIFKSFRYERHVSVNECSMVATWKRNTVLPPFDESISHRYSRGQSRPVKRVKFTFAVDRHVRLAWYSSFFFFSFTGGGASLSLAVALDRSPLHPGCCAAGGVPAETSLEASALVGHFQNGRLCSNLIQLGPRWMDLIQSRGFI